MLSLLIGCMKLLFVTIFGPGQWQGAQNVGCSGCNGSLPFPLWAKQVQNENTEMFHEVLKEMNSHLPRKSAGEHSSKCGTL
jgi:hypothetical protein